MTKTIAQLWNGNVEPIQKFGRNNAEIRQLEILMERNHKRLEEALDEKGKEFQKKYDDCVNEYLIINSEQAFCDGFCLGAKIIAEALTGVEEILKD